MFFSSTPAPVPLPPSPVPPIEPRKDGGGGDKIYFDLITFFSYVKGREGQRQKLFYADSKAEQ